MLESTTISLCVVVLLPAMPTFLLFRWVKGARAKLTGPLGRLTMTLHGAFAGYFALMLVTAGFYLKIRPPVIVPPDVEAWTVTGSLEFEGADQPEVSKIYCKASDPELYVDPGNTFRWRVPVVKGADMPRIFVKPSGYQGDTLYLSRVRDVNNFTHEPEVDAVNRRITFGKIKFRKEESSTQIASFGGRP